MALIPNASRGSLEGIRSWLGLNEAPEGGGALKTGEAAVMRNWRITRGGALKKRGGTQNVALLSCDFDLSEGEEFMCWQETAPSGRTFACYSLAYADGLGTVRVQGPPAELDGGECVGKYFVIEGQVFRFTRVSEDTEGGAQRRMWYAVPVTAVRRTASEQSAVRAIWSGFVSGREVLCAACGGHLWQLRLDGEGVWTKTDCGALGYDGDVGLFGFDGRLYILGAPRYLVWDGESLSAVEGYVPLVKTATTPQGEGQLLEQINKLTSLRRQRFSPDGSSTVFSLAESGLAAVKYVRAVGSGGDMDGWTANLEDGTVSFAEAPPEGIDTVEVCYDAGKNFASEIAAMRFAELYNGAQDSRVFIYGDGTNRCLYSGLDDSGRPRADYFPDLNEARIGDENTPLTALIRHYGRLLAFKLDSAYSLSYDAITLADGSVTAGFYVTPVNRDVGNCAPGQARLVENRPRTLDGRSVMEWLASTGGTVSSDQRNARDISRRVALSIRGFDLGTARTFYDKLSGEYYVLGDNGTALVNNVVSDAWYVYTGFDARCMINYRDEVYIGTSDGYLRHFSDKYLSDCGSEIDALWESGDMVFGADTRRKYSAMLWLMLKPEERSMLEVTAKTDMRDSFLLYRAESPKPDGPPRAARLRLKARRFSGYRLILRNCSADTRATVLSAEIRVTGAGYAR